MPWGEYTNDHFDLKRAKKILDRDHFGLEKVKERILEHLAVLKLKGDGKNYQFRVKDKFYKRYSYIHEFQTNGEWQTIEIPFDVMYASFRGNRLDIPNYNGSQMQEIAFLIANKRNEQFNLMIDSIAIE